MLEIAVRGYRAGDFEAMFRLDEICFGPEFRFSRSATRRFAESRRARVILAEAGERLAGFVITHIEKTPAGCAGYIVTLDVHPEFRRQGLAAKLMQNAEATTRGEGCKAMLLHVFTGNAAAIAFYESQGFGRSHTVEDFYENGLDAFVYRKAL